ncbi:MAG: DUF1800 family protein [Proteobacteria bacterium]|nr:DUF1800 family protein [Pseudomonadota bacterium]
MRNRRFVLSSGAALVGGLILARRAPAATLSAPALSANERALHALNRLGYGPRPADAAAIAKQGAGPWLERFLDEQLQPSRLAAPESLTQQLSALEVLSLGQAELVGRYRDAIKAAREAKREQAQGMKPDADAANAVREKVRPLVAEAATARLARALQSPAQLEEVLTEFWFNHFNVFAGKGPVSVLVADYEQRAIRPFVLGRFRDMLGATARHPAMLTYLDNAQSVVAGYEPPRRARRFLDARPELKARQPTGLNENYARELMELHTLGVDGGYSQRDVTELARMLTGWGIDIITESDYQARRLLIDGSQQELRLLPGVSELIALSLATSGFISIRAVAGADVSLLQTVPGLEGDVSDEEGPYISAETLYDAAVKYVVEAEMRGETLRPATIQEMESLEPGGDDDSSDDADGEAVETPEDAALSDVGEGQSSVADEVDIATGGEASEEETGLETESATPVVVDGEIEAAASDVSSPPAADEAPG